MFIHYLTLGSNRVDPLRHPLSSSSLSIMHKMRHPCTCVLVCVCARQRLPLAPGLHWNVICISNSTSWFAHCANLSPSLSPLLRPCVSSVPVVATADTNVPSFSVSNDLLGSKLDWALCVCVLAARRRRPTRIRPAAHTHTHTHNNQHLLSSS